MERTLVLVKPDGVRRLLVGEIIGRFERRSLSIKGLKIVQPTTETAERHYDVHQGKPFFESLVKFITSGPVVAVVLEGEDAISNVRRMMGSLKPTEALPGTIRGDFTLSVQENIVHGSDSSESSDHEISVWFDPDELLP